MYKLDEYIKESLGLVEILSEITSHEVYQWFLVCPKT